MNEIEMKRNQIVKQIEIDRQTKEQLKSFTFWADEELAFCDKRIAQLEEILKNGHGIFNLFKNDQVKITLI